MKRLLFAFFYLSGVFIFLHAQTGKLYSTDNELSNSLINTIFQDSRNYIWVATEDGLNKYDGVKFSIYRNDKLNPHSLKNNYVRSLFEDSKGRFWVGCVNGLMLYDRVNDSFTEVPLYYGNKIIEPHVSSIIETKSGEILISTSSDAILRFDAKKNLFRVDNELIKKLCSRYIVTLFEDSKQNLWIASADKGVNYYNQKTGTIKLYKAPESLGNNQISSMVEDDAGNIFVGTLAGGLFKLNAATQKFDPVPYNKGDVYLPIKCLYLDRNKRLLIGTDGRGIKVYNKATQKIEDFEVQSAIFDFSSTKVHSVLLDKAGNLNALKMATKSEGVKKNELIHHSDRGIQYCCNDYVNYLNGCEMNISMTENGDPYENAIAERVNGILKTEYGLDETFSNYLAANEAVKTAVYKYNNKRPHASCDYMTPAQAHTHKGELKKRWQKRKLKSADNFIEMQR